ncbi:MULTISPECIES: Nudix family hydrolase [unclassified Dyella]|uniref:Nudix family hydrolase n=1 Tax=unclassified Dyella TaxID=2634549 RepID=UPI000C81B26F|nr:MULTISPECIES: Nudix family hydrolase [unclassified Dyella]MDR3444781.1 Nudix family hydrolase [Dyella sp.]PMQ06848.1 CTP pyrophosphohydrolase [Dyella sp. AD56]
MTATTAGAMHVMAGVMLDSLGRVLLAQRPPGKHLAGLWEFPGGKLEAGEAPTDGLVRELHEELGVEATVSESLIRVPWRYGERSLLLDARVVRVWRGEPASLDGQALQWCDPHAVDLDLLAPADRYILRALQLPARYAITADVPPSASDEWRQRVRHAIAAGEQMILLRFPQWPVALVRALAAELLPEARTQGTHLLLSGDVEGALALGEGVGLQLKAAQLSTFHVRPLPPTQRIGASCHHADDLRRALGVADFATLSPVALTTTHPDAAPMGWARFEALVDESALPVYALGGMSSAQIDTAQQAGGQGVAGIRGFW